MIIFYSIAALIAYILIGILVVSIVLLYEKVCRRNPTFKDDDYSVATVVMMWPFLLLFIIVDVTSKTMASLPDKISDFLIRKFKNKNETS